MKLQYQKMGRHQLYLVITIMFLLTFTHCLGHQEIDNFKQSQKMNHKLHLKINQITPLFQHKTSVQSQIQQHHINYQHVQEDQQNQHNQQLLPAEEAKPQISISALGCTQQQKNKAKTAIDGCQMEAIRDQGACISKFLNINPKQKWNIFIVKKGKPDDLLIAQKRCVIKNLLYGQFQRDYYLWPSYEPVDWANQQTCDLKKIDEIKQKTATCKEVKSNRKKAACVVKQIKDNFGGEEWNVVINEVLQQSSIISDSKFKFNSYKKFHSFRKCVAMFGNKQGDRMVGYTAWIA